MKEKLEKNRNFNATSSFYKFEIQKHYQNNAKLTLIMDGTYVINLDESKSIRTHWIALDVNSNNVKYFDNFGVECIPKECAPFIELKQMIQYWSIGFIDFMFNIKMLRKFTDLLSYLYMNIFNTLIIE